jgi:predicted secreted Zn-dependent protease
VVVSRVPASFVLFGLMGVAACGESSRPDVYESAGSGAVHGHSAGAAPGTGASGGASDSNGQGGGAPTPSEGGDTSQGGEPTVGDDGECPSPFTTLDLSELETTETIEPYSIVGDTAGELRQSLNQLRPDGYDARTSWYLTWQYGNSACDGTALNVTADVTYTMPEWEPPDSADPELVEHWGTYLTALFCHEYGHAEFGLEAAQEVFSTLSAIDANGDCDEQQLLAAAAFQSILDDYTAREIDYDNDTQHGATMGATFP